MTNLVTKSDLDAYKYIADSVKNHATWAQFVSEAQMLDVKHWLGDGLLLEIVGQVESGTLTALNTKLLDGGTYTYATRNYHFQGLKATIIYYAFARFTNRTPFNYTAAGIVIKESDFSTPATTKDVQRLTTEAQLTAEALRCEVEIYLNRNYASYPLWRDGNCVCGSRCADKRPFKAIGD
jgi:hypothetical protein